MSATPSSHSSVQRLNKAYVQVPPSPLTLSSYRSLNTSSHVVSSSKLKENTPLRPFQLANMSNHSASTASSKRKASDRDSSSLILDGVNPSATKKSKLSASAATTSNNNTPLKTKQTSQSISASNACPEFPNGWTYCHQCNKKRDLNSEY